MYDIVIVGAGPGGSAAAYFLAQAGLKVLLLDKFNFPRDKTCGDALTPRALAVLEDMGILDDLLRLGYRNNGVEIFAPHGHTTAAPVRRQPGPHGYVLVIPRLILDNAILERAQRSGAEFQSPVYVTDVEPSLNGVVVKGGRHGRSVSIKAQAAIVATGASPKLLLRLGLLKQTPPMMLAARAYFEGVKGLGDRLHFRFDGVPLPGYGWVFPLPDSVANIGAGFQPKGRRRPTTPGAAFESFIQTAPLQAMLTQARRVGPVKGHPLRTDFATAPTYGQRVLLVGEAAGLVNPLTGEGIDYALESGKLAGEHLAHLFASGNLSCQSLAEYDHLLRQRFQRLFVSSNWLRYLSMNRPMLNCLVRLADYQAELKMLLIDFMLGQQHFGGGMTPKP